MSSHLPGGFLLSDLQPTVSFSTHSALLALNQASPILKTYTQSPSCSHPHPPPSLCFLYTCFVSVAKPQHSQRFSFSCLTHPYPLQPGFCPATPMNCSPTVIGNLVSTSDVLFVTLTCNLTSEQHSACGPLRHLKRKTCWGIRLHDDYSGDGVKDVGEQLLKGAEGSCLFPNLQSASTSSPASTARLR